MPPQNSRSEFERRMHRVIAHIEQHLDQPLDLHTLADVAHVPGSISTGFLPHGWARRWATICAAAGSRSRLCGSRPSRARRF